MAKKKSKTRNRPVGKAKHAGAKSKVVKKKARPAKAASKAKKVAKATKPARKAVVAKAAPKPTNSAKKVAKRKVAKPKSAAPAPGPALGEPSETRLHESIPEPSAANVEASTA